MKKKKRQQIKAEREAYAQDKVLKETAKSGWWGLLDTKDKVWIGDNKGPITYNDKDVARIAARIIDVQLKQPAGRTRAVIFYKATRKLDEKKVYMTPLQALEHLESGRVL